MGDPSQRGDAKQDCPYNWFGGQQIDIPTGIQIGIARGAQEVYGVLRTHEARDGEAKEGPEISGGISSVSKSPFWSEEGARFYGEDFLGCGILYLG